MAENVYIRQIRDTIANIFSGAGDKIAGHASDGGTPYVFKDGSTLRMWDPSRTSADGTTFIYQPLRGSTGHFGGASNYSSFESDGTLVASGDATTWDDMRIVPGAFQFAGVSDPTLSTYQPGGSGATFQIYEFQAADEVFFTCQLPHTYVQGSDIYPHVHWGVRSRGVAESGNTVAWKLDYSWANVGGAFGASATVDMTDTCTGTDDLHEITPSSAAITGTSRNISSMLLCRLYRDSGDTWATNTAGNRPILLEFDIHFEINTMGSRQILTK